LKRTLARQRKNREVRDREARARHAKHPDLPNRSRDSQTQRDNHSVLWQCAAVKLPNAEKAVVERDKAADYLLNAAHPDNGGKAAFFEGLGFRRSESEILAKALQKLARQAEITESATSPHGEKYVIVGEVESSTGKAANVQTPKAFGVDNGWDVARLVTAYPHKI